MHITELRTVKEWICNFHLIICQVRLSPKAVGWTHVVCTQQFAHNRPWDTSARACIQPYTWLFETGDALLENLCQSSGSGKEIKKIYEKKGCGCVDWSWGSRQWRRELYGLIVLCRRGIEDDEEAFPWECCCVLLEQTHSLISCLGRNKHWQLIWRGVSLHLFELCRKATEPWLNLRDKSAGHPLGPCCLCW